MNQKFTVDSLELDTLSDFLTEMRVARGLPPITFSSHSASNAMWFLFVITGQACATWRSCCDVAHRSCTDPRYLYRTTASRLWQDVSSSGFPSPQYLLSHLHADQALARLSIRSPTESQPAEPQREARSAVEIETVAEVKQPDYVADENQTWTVSDWSQLTLGLDEQHRTWALPAGLGRGDTFRLRDAKQLTIGGKQWHALLKSLADSGDGTAKIDELLIAMREPPPARTTETGRALEESLLVKACASRKRMSAINKELAKRLRKEVKCQARAPAFSLEDGQEIVRTSIRMGYIFKENGNYYYGRPPC